MDTKDCMHDPARAEEWKEATEYKGEKRHDALVQIYEDKLEHETDAEYVWSFGVNDSDMEKRTKYYIIHATHHIDGLRVMKNIMRARVTRSEALLWFNATYVEGADVSVVWLLPSGAEYFVDAGLIPGEDDVDTLPWYDGLSSLSIMGESSSLATGRWRVEVYLDGVFQDCAREIKDQAKNIIIKIITRSNGSLKVTYSVTR